MHLAERIRERPSWRRERLPAQGLDHQGLKSGRSENLEYFTPSQAIRVEARPSDEFALPDSFREPQAINSAADVIPKIHRMGADGTLPHHAAQLEHARLELPPADVLKHNVRPGEVDALIGDRRE